MWLITNGHIKSISRKSQLHMATRASDNIWLKKRWRGERPKFNGNYIMKAIPNLQTVVQSLKFEIWSQSPWAASSLEWIKTPRAQNRSLEISNKRFAKLTYTFHMVTWPMDFQWLLWGGNVFVSAHLHLHYKATSASLGSDSKQLRQD